MGSSQEAGPGTELQLVLVRFYPIVERSGSPAIVLRVAIKVPAICA